MEKRGKLLTYRVIRKRRGGCYYPQREMLGLWFYMRDDRIGLEGRAFFSSQSDAVQFIDKKINDKRRKKARKMAKEKKPRKEVVYRICVSDTFTENRNTLY